jgi:tetratricopeptide (TPR) repeat protein
MNYFTTVASLILLFTFTGLPVVSAAQDVQPKQSEQVEDDIKLSKLAVYYRSQGYYTKAESLFDRVITIRKAAKNVWMSGEPDVAISLSEGLHNLAVLKLEQGKLEEAEELFTNVLSICERTRRRKDETQRMLGILYRIQGDYSQSVMYFELSLEGRQGEVNSDLKKAGLEKTYELQGKLSNEKVNKLKPKNISNRIVNLEAGISAAEKNFGPDHRYLYPPLRRLAIAYMDAGQYALAEPLYKRVLEYHNKVSTSQKRKNEDIYDLAEIYFKQKKFDLAEPLYKKFRSLNKKEYKPKIINYDVLSKIAAVYIAQGKYTEAEKDYKRAVKESEKKLGLDHPVVAAKLTDLAVFYRLIKKDKEAGNLERRAARILKFHV